MLREQRCQQEVTDNVNNCVLCISVNKISWKAGKPLQRAGIVCCVPSKEIGPRSTAQNVHHHQDHCGSTSAINNGVIELAIEAITTKMLVGKWFKKKPVLIFVMIPKRTFGKYLSDDSRPETCWTC